MNQKQLPAHTTEITTFTRFKHKESSRAGWFLNSIPAAQTRLFSRRPSASLPSILDQVTVRTTWAPNAHGMNTTTF